MQQPSNTALLDGILEGLFPMYSLQSKEQRRNFREYCDSLIRTSSNTGYEETLIQSVLSYFDVNLLVIDENTGCLLSSVFVPHGSLGRALLPPQCTKEERASSNKTDRSVVRLNHLVKKEQSRLERQRRLNKFLRTGIRSEIVKDDNGSSFESLQDMARLRNNSPPCNTKWEALSAWHRRRLYQKYLDTANLNDEDDDVLQAVVAAVRSTSPIVILSLPTPLYDKKKSEIKSLLSSQNVVMRSNGPKKKHTKHSSKRRRSNRKKGGLNTLLAQCRKLRQENKRIQNRSVVFTGTFVS